jgi:hypothetical protein
LLKGKERNYLNKEKRKESFGEGLLSEKAI